MFKKLCVVTLCLFSLSAYANELTAEKKHIIDELLDVTGAAQMGEMMGAAVANSIISSISQQSGNVDPKMVEVIQDEVALIMHEEFIASNWLNEMSYDVYHKYLTTKELKEILAFYKTPIGKKVVTVMPYVTQEAMIAGQTHGQSLGPLIQQRLQLRLQKEGFINK